MDDSQVIKYAYADSTNRDVTIYPSGSEYTLHLTNPIKNIVRIDLVAAKVPNTMYNVTNGNNFVSIDGTDVSISPGYYSANGLSNAIMNASGNAITMEFLCDEGKYLFSSPNPFTIDPLTAEAKRMIGLTTSTSSFPASTDPVYALDPTYGALEIAKSTHIVDLAVNEYVFLDIQEFRTTSVLDAKKLVNGTTEGSSIRSSFGMIPMDVPGGSIKNYKETSDYKQYVEYDYPIVKLDRLTVRWIDKSGRLLNFNGFENNAFTLRFKCIFVKPDPPPPPLRDVELDRIVDALKNAPPPPKPPQEKQAWGRWVILLIVIFCLIVYVGYVRVVKPLQEKIIDVMSQKPPPPPQMRLF
jgi:hypothetical protein